MGIMTLTSRITTRPTSLFREVTPPYFCPSCRSSCCETRTFDIKINERWSNSTRRVMRIKCLNTKLENQILLGEESIGKSKRNLFLISHYEHNWRSVVCEINFIPNTEWRLHSLNAKSWTVFGDRFRLLIFFEYFLGYFVEFLVFFART